MTVEMITITKEEYYELVDTQNFMNCLVGAGVDNWEGYDEALEEYKENYGEDD